MKLPRRVGDADQLAQAVDRPVIERQVDQEEAHGEAEDGVLFLDPLVLHQAETKKKMDRLKLMLRITFLTKNFVITKMKFNG